MFYLLMNVFIFEYVYKKLDFTTIKSFHKTNEVILKFKDIQDSEDIELLTNLLIKYKINTRARIANLIDHYRILIPRKFSGDGVLISLSALSISVSAFLYDLKMDIVLEKFQIGVLILSILLFIYITNKRIYKIFGTRISHKALYIRLEALLTEIYMSRTFK